MKKRCTIVSREDYVKSKGFVYDNQLRLWKKQNKVIEKSIMSHPNSKIFKKTVDNIDTYGNVKLKETKTVSAKSEEEKSRKRWKKAITFRAKHMLSGSFGNGKKR